MSVGLGLPIGDPAQLLSWARRAEATPFTTVALLDRLVFGNPEPLITLATLAGATSRIRLQTEVLLAPLHRTALLAKQAATLDLLSGSRFTLGIGIGGRDDDYLASGIDLRTRGRRLDTQMATLRRLWSGEPLSADVGPIGPAPARPGGPEVLFGGFVPAALERVARWGDGFLGAALPPGHMDGLFRQVEDAWDRAGRTGRPRLVAQVNAALGPQPTLDRARAELRAYYAPHSYTDHVVNGLLTSGDQIREAVAAFRAIGADEVMLYCWSPDPDQVERLAGAVFHGE
ncbi:MULTISPECIES: LLM class flavin-dependent oxidoreductase [Streptomyces]|uniref:LLM class flavin-dependent oxidoreductase n=2 Tax=Streptomyces nigrescens TaxID=1920 RepID=A0A640TCA6_STRNI|nr:MULTISPECIES: LLM class flavin-dependent oxidoreductase [Streptomyces]AWN30320.1 LLM class flavin-dependent oxidoreductase [Streptomyces sp. NEAU-S7GS2]MCX5447394.1 LLM class flavin-dependent oxidoreductase [Streptomyces libani]WAT96043.1 LLM class flavin-dependent oxidoreductase [Streptomyces libani subsp. libani]WAU03665.1 LLM class flavin-dependent oxidoreductase [Streptomyces nigrescens]GFE21367.1 luciferase [Streptomyces libani subsp. libani]